MKIFKWDVGVDSSSQVKYAVKKVQFGDGYEQRQAQGLAPILESWNVSVVGQKSYIDEIKKFLDEHGGYKAFMWRVTPDEDYKKYIAASYRRSAKGGGIWKIDLEMQQVMA